MTKLLTTAAIMLTLASTALAYPYSPGICISCWSGRRGEPPDRHPFYGGYPGYRFSPSGRGSWYNGWWDHSRYGTFPGMRFTIPRDRYR